MTNNVVYHIHTSLNKTSRRATKDSYYKIYQVMWQWYALFYKEYVNSKKRKRKPFSINFNFAAIRDNTVIWSTSLSKEYREKPTLADYYEFASLMVSLDSDKKHQIIVLKKLNEETYIKHTLGAFAPYVNIARFNNTGSLKPFSDLPVSYTSEHSKIRMINTLHSIFWDFSYLDSLNVFHCYSASLEVIHNHLWQRIQEDFKKGSACNGLYLFYLKYPAFAKNLNEKIFVFVPILFSQFHNMHQTKNTRIHFYNLVSHMIEKDIMGDKVQKLVNSYYEKLTEELTFIRPHVIFNSSKLNEDDNERTTRLVKKD